MVQKIAPAAPADGAKRRPAYRLSTSIPAAYGEEWQELKKANRGLTDSQMLVKLMVEAKTCKVPSYLEML